MLIPYFYEGLLPMDRSMIDVANNAALVDKTPSYAKDLIANTAKNSQQFGSRVIIGTKGVGEIACISHQRMEHRLEELTQ